MNYVSKPYTQLDRSKFVLKLGQPLRREGGYLAGKDYLVAVQGQLTSGSFPQATLIEYKKFFTHSFLFSVLLLFYFVSKWGQGRSVLPVAIAIILQPRSPTIFDYI